MLEVAHMGLHVAQMTGQAQMRQIFEAVTANAAKVMGLEGYGLAPGCRADMVILQAADPHEALRLKPARLYVIRRGKIIAETPPVVSRVNLKDESIQVDFKFPSSD
jgi:cytosine deaminase